MSFSVKRATFAGSKSFEGAAEGVAFAEDDDPGQAGLKSFEHEQLPKGAAVALGHAPLGVVVGAEERVALAHLQRDFSGGGHGVMIDAGLLAC